MADSTRKRERKNMWHLVGKTSDSDWARVHPYPGLRKSSRQLSHGKMKPARLAGLQL
jgi:hypothetical protein